MNLPAELMMIRSQFVLIVIALGFSLGCGEPPPRPSLSSVAPDQARAGDLINISGVSLGDSPQGRSLRVHGKDVTRIVSWTAGRIAAYVPAEAEGIGDVIVLIEGQPTNALSLKIVTPDPYLADIDPKKGYPGNEVTVSGSNFGETRGTVTLGEAEAKVKKWTADSITVIVPEGFEEGDISVKLPDGRTTDAASFRRLSPRLFALEPEAGQPGSSMTLKGRDFGEDVEAGRVTFGEEEAEVLSWANKAIEVRVPDLPRTGGMLDVKVQVHGSWSKAIAIPLPAQPPVGYLPRLDQPMGPQNYLFFKTDGWPLLVYGNQIWMGSAEWNGFSWVSHDPPKHPDMTGEIEGNPAPLPYGSRARVIQDTRGIIHGVMDNTMKESTYYATLENGKWAIDVEIPAPKKSTGLTYGMTLDHKGRPVVATFSEYFGLDLHTRLGKKEWNIARIHADGSEDTRASRVDLETDSKGRIHLAFFDGKRGELRHGQGLSPDDGKTWEMPLATVDKDKIAGAYCKMAIGPKDEVAIIYQTKEGTSCRLATRAPGQDAFTLTTLHEGPGAGYYGSVAFDNEGKIHALHCIVVEGEGTRIDYVTNITGSFVARTLTTGMQLDIETQSPRPTATLAPDGRMWVMYGDWEKEVLTIRKFPETADEARALETQADPGRPISISTVTSSTILSDSNRNWINARD